MDQKLFIADLHLAPERPATIQQFLRFLTTQVADSKSLYILGDLFDFWIGDDDDTPPYPAIIDALHSVTAGGTELFIQHGNRDFLLGRRFMRATGAQLLRDPTLIDLYGTPTLLMHGDLLCSADIAYQKFRRYARNPLLIKIFLLRSVAARRRQANLYRQRSSTATAAKTAAIMDVTQDIVEAYMRRFGAYQLIHGHTHRPGQHDFRLDGLLAKRWVLAEWQPDLVSILCADSGGLRVEYLP